MNIVRNIIREEVCALLNEGRFDKFTGEIIDLIWGAIKHSKQGKKKESSFHFKFKSPLFLEIYLFLSREKSDDVAYEVGGATLIGTHIMNVSVNIESPNRNFEHLVYSEINSELHNVVRHEIEHIVQQRGKNKIAGRVDAISPKERRKAENTIGYFLSKDEIPALVAGFYKQAKNDKKPLDVVASEYLDYFTDEEDGILNGKEKDLVMNDLMNYARQNYPNAIFSKTM